MPIVFAYLLQQTKIVHRVSLGIFLALCCWAAGLYAQSPPEYYKGWPLKGYPLIIHKKKFLPVFPSITLADEFEKIRDTLPSNPTELKKQVEKMGGKMIENKPGDFADIAKSYIQFIEPVPLKADRSFSFNCKDKTQQIAVAKDQEFLLYYQDPYILIVGNREKYCLIDLLYNIRPVPFSLDKKPKIIWWLNVFEAGSFASGWIKFDDRFFFRNFNPRYLKNFNNYSGLSADFEKTVVFKSDPEDLINGLYWDAADFDAITGKFKTHCLFIHRGIPDEENPALYSITALNINPEHIKKFQIAKGKLRFGWRGETASVVIQLDTNLSGCDIHQGITAEPKMYPETKKVFPYGIGVIINNDIFIRAVDYQELTEKTLFRHYYALKSRRSDDILRYTPSDAYIIDQSDDTFPSQNLKKWEQVFIHEINNGWARINVRRIQAFGWVPEEHLIYATQRKKFPPFETLNQYISESN